LLDWSILSPRERLAAEQAVLTLRELDKAADNAPHGQGFACLEAVALAQGMQHLRDMMTASLGARDEAQKKGSAFAAAAVAAKRSSRRAAHAKF
jgi:hypothetical protein